MNELKTNEGKELVVLKLELQEKDKEINRLTSKGLAIKEENLILLASPNIQGKIAEMNYHLSVADKMIKSKAFPTMTPEQAYVIIMAGAELGIPPMQSMTNLYIVNGVVGFHSKGLSGWLTKHGYKITFSNESDNGVTCTITGNGFSETESCKRSDKVFEKSKAITFAPKNKMRFHCIRQVANFHLAHLFGSVSIWDDDDTNNQTKGDLIELLDENVKEQWENELQNCSNLDALEKFRKSSKPTNKRIIQLFEIRKSQLNAGV